MPQLPAGQNVPLSSVIVTNPTNVTWSDGTLFDGFIWVGITLPTSPAYDYAWLADIPRLQRLPQFIRILIVNGAVDGTTQLLYSTSMEPTGTKYVAYFCDSSGKVIAPASGTAVPFVVNSPTTTINVPSLTAPSGATNPVPQS